CAGGCVNFTDMSTNNPTSWKWDFPGAAPSSSTAQNPQNICYYFGGTYDVTLTVYNSAGSDSVTLLNYVQVFPTPPTPVITPTGNVLHCTTDPSYVSYQWYADTTLIPNATDTFVVISQSGNYNIAVTDTNGCSISVGINIVLGNLSYIKSHFSMSPNPAGD